MSKMNELSMLLDNLIECGETLTETARALKAFYSSDNEPSAAPAKPLPPTEEPAAPEAKQPESKPEKTYSKEEIRAMLAAKANEADGIYKVDVRNLVRKYGNGGSLTDVEHHRHTVGLPVHQARNSAQRKPTNPVHTPSRVLTPMHSVSTRS